MRRFLIPILLAGLSQSPLFAVRDSSMINFSSPSMGKNSETYSDVIEEAAHFLALIDQEQYNSAWSESAPIMRAIVPMDIWSEGVRYIRHDLGLVQAREVISHQNLSSLPGGLTGNYYRVTYRTQYYAGRSKNETLTLSAEGLGRWRVISYSFN